MLVPGALTPRSSWRSGWGSRRSATRPPQGPSRPAASGRRWWSARKCGWTTTDFTIMSRARGC